MTASLSALEQELSIPSDAFLPAQGAAKLSAQASSSVSISISPETSIHSSTKCLLIGRQASTADIRIDHKSISRKHAALYFISNNDDNNKKLMLRDLGGKYGCLVNGVKVANKTEVGLVHGDRIQFGNVREQIFTAQFDTKSVWSSPERKSRTKNGVAEATLEETELGDVGDSQIENRNNEDGDDQDKPVLTGRAAREAEIAAMMASLDETPAYTKYKQKDEHNRTMKNQEREETHTGPKQQHQQQLPPIAEQLKIPITSHISLTGPSSSSLPTSVSLDPSGSRILVGSSDACIRLYDFNGMDLSAKPFKIVTVQEGHSIVQSVFSNSGDRIIVGTTSAQPMILDRDGNEIIEFNKGDMYVTDMAHTDGHVANVTGVDWHPLERNIVITSSLDGSVRLWDVERNKTKFQKLCCKGKDVYRIKSSMGKRTVVTCVVMAPGGREFACGTSCGSIQIWSTLKVGSRPDRVIYDAHGHGGTMSIHSLVYSPDGKKLASRCMEDDKILVWDARRLSRSAKPLVRCGGLRALHECINCTFSPDGRLICAGTSVEPRVKESYGMLKFYRTDAATTTASQGQQPILELDIAKGLSVVNVAWHNKLNQIIVGLSDGSLKVFYDSKWSVRGAKLPVSKGLRKTDDLTLLLNSRAPQGMASIASLGDIRTPNSLPLFRNDKEKNTKRKREKDRQDPVKSKRPDLPGTGIKVSEGTSASMNFQQTVLTSAIAKNKNIAGKDPREELFKYSAEEKYTVGDKRVLADKTVEEEEEEMG